MLSLLALWPWLLALPDVQEDASAVSAPPPPPAETWEFSAGLYVFDPPDDDLVLTPIVTADRGALHLEARYNYEELDTGSLFVGRNFSFGEELHADVTPILGAVVGELDGIAPGLELEVTWKGFEFSSESEYVFDLGADGEDFLYSWNELTYSPAEWVRFGLIGQRTRLFDQELEVDRGLLLGFAFESFWVDLYLFNPDRDDAYLGGGIGIDF